MGIATPSVLLVLASGAALAEDFAPTHQGNAPSATELNKVRKFGKLPIKIQLAAQSMVA